MRLELALDKLLNLIKLFFEFHKNNEYSNLIENIPIFLNQAGIFLFI